MLVCIAVRLEAPEENKSGYYLRTLFEHIPWLTDLAIVTKLENYNFFKKLIVNFSRVTAEIISLLSGIGSGELTLRGRNVTRICNTCILKN